MLMLPLSPVHNLGAVEDVLRHMLNVTVVM